MFTYEFHDAEALLAEINSTLSGSWFFPNTSAEPKHILSIKIDKMSGGKNKAGQYLAPCMQIQMEADPDAKPSDLDAIARSTAITRCKFPPNTFTLKTICSQSATLFEMISTAEKHLELFDPAFKNFMSRLLKVPAPAPVPSIHHSQSFFEPPQQSILTLLKTRTQRAEWIATGRSCSIILEERDKLEILLNVLLIAKDMPDFSISGTRTLDGKHCITVEGNPPKPALQLQLPQHELDGSGAGPSMS